MRHRGWILLSLVLLLGLVGAYWAYDRLVNPGPAHARAVPAGDQEIACLFPATSGDTWERLIAALVLLDKEWPSAHPGYPRLKVQLDNAFFEETAAVPEVALWFEGREGSKLWVRWYKLSGEFNSRRWFQELLKRGTPPLAILGGDVSGRFLAQAQGLAELRDQWTGTPPLLLVTTATAELYDPRANQTGVLVNELMKVYEGRTFRFCFTNTYMARAVIDFLRQHRNVWPSLDCDPAFLASVVAHTDPWGTLGLLARGRHLQPLSLYALAWNDDLYSHDLADRFGTVFVEHFQLGELCLNNYIDYSVGDPFRPNPSEERTLDLYLAQNDQFHFDATHQMLVLPTGVPRARRFLKTLCRRAPAEIRNLVVVSGDSISFNAIYRDRDIAWNILDLPVPLVFFSHRNPIDADAGFGQKNELGLVNATGSQDLLLYRDILEAFLQAAHDGTTWLGDTNQIQERLRHMRWFEGRIHQPANYPAAETGHALFWPTGNRRRGTGEHVVLLQPVARQHRLLSEAVISIWSAAAAPEGNTWRLAGPPLQAGYNRPLGGQGN